MDPIIPFKTGHLEKQSSTFIMISSKGYSILKLMV